MECKAKIKLIDYFYGELRGSDLEEMKKHIATCRSCSEEIQNITKTSAVFSKRSRPKPERALLRSYRRELKFIYQDAGWYRKLFDFLIIKPAYSIRLVEITAVLLVGIFIGKFFFHTPVQQAKNLQTSSDTRLLDNYLFETELLLLETANSDAYHEFKYIMDDIDCQRLLQKTFILKEAARETKNHKLENFLDRLEIILLEVSNIKDDVSGEELEYVKKSIKDLRIFTELKEIQIVNVS